MTDRKLTPRAGDRVIINDHQCTCVPCERPQYGAPGYAHCVACCYGSLIEQYDLECPEPGHQRMAKRQFGIVR